MRVVIVLLAVVAFELLFVDVSEYLALMVAVGVWAAIFDILELAVMWRNR